MSPHHPVTLLIVGAGERGRCFAQYALDHPNEARVTAVAEPNDFRREQLASRHALAPDMVFRGWEELIGRERVADAAVVATQDAIHEAPAIALAREGYHLLLEKPMAASPEPCRRIVREVSQAGVIFAVCHVMRYTAYTRRLKAIIDGGRVGEVVSVQHLEPVGYWHHAHSFVRGNWRREDLASPMLLAKSCHDLDWLRHIVGRPCRRVSSFGSLKHFRRDQQPVGAADCCLDCAVEPGCPYSARKIYLDRISAGNPWWPVSVLTDEPTVESVTESLRTGPYGRCVYASDNDVVDHQVVSMEFDGGASAVFTMVAFSEMTHRQTRIFGTRGQITGDGETIEIYDFLTERRETIDTRAGAGDLTGGHGGGDEALMRDFVRAVAMNDPSAVLTGPDETLESHLMVFAAERARREGRVVDLAELLDGQHAPSSV